MHIGLAGYERLWKLCFGGGRPQQLSAAFTDCKHHSARPDKSIESALVLLRRFVLTRQDQHGRWRIGGKSGQWFNRSIDLVTQSAERQIRGARARGSRAVGRRRASTWIRGWSDQRTDATE